MSRPERFRGHESSDIILSGVAGDGNREAPKCMRQQEVTVRGGQHRLEAVLFKKTLMAFAHGDPLTVEGGYACRRWTNQQGIVEGVGEVKG